MSHIIATIDESLINAILAKAGPIEGEEYREAEPVLVPYIGIGATETPLGIKVPFPCKKERTVIPWKVTLKWSVSNIRVEILEDIALFKADVHAESESFSYSEPVQGTFKASLKKTTLLVTLQSLTVTLYIKPKNIRIDILTFDIIDKLPQELSRMRFGLPFNSNLEIPLPNEERLSLSAKDISMSLKNGRIVVTANLETPNF